MKRALHGIVPDKILNRKRKDSGSRWIKSDVPQIKLVSDVGNGFISSVLGIVNYDALVQALKESCFGQNAHIRDIPRTMLLEAWLRHLSVQRVLAVDTTNCHQTSWLSSQENGLRATSSVG